MKRTGARRDESAGTEPLAGNPFAQAVPVVDQFNVSVPVLLNRRVSNPVFPTGTIALSVSFAIAISAVGAEIVNGASL